MKPHILICNDDGIYAPGIMALFEAVRDIGEVTVVAPDAEQSAVGHAITLSNPIKIKQVRRNAQFEGYAVVGTPADCIKLAVTVLLERPPDLIISGINLGPNVGISVIYSGTVSAATEGAILGIPSMAISLATFKDPIWETAAHVARRLTQEIITRGLPADTLLNVNVPNRTLKQVKGLAVTRMGRSRFAEIFHKRTNPRGDTYYWMDGELKITGDTGGTDIQALADGLVSLTPIWFDLTHTAVLPKLNDWNLTL
ncbi:MAG: 5'/3'-nucleotidase SurE [Kiritimatiellae bacterium]|nr:5'/3'-nucleotidase SurE [Kiritimatiellia bacterium]